MYLTFWKLFKNRKKVSGSLKNMPYGFFTMFDFFYQKIKNQKSPLLRNNQLKLLTFSVG